ncbi:hypothetical protein V5799_021221, partial [Amblyomma americanum]
STAMDHAPRTLLFFFVACYCSSNEYFVAGGVASGSEQPLENQLSTMVNDSISASLSSVQSRIVTDINSGGHRLAEISEDKNTNKVVSCNLLGEETLIKMILKNIPAAQVTNASTEEMNQLVNTRRFTQPRYIPRTNCADDRKLYNCLLNDSSATSVGVGTIYFDVLKTQCFEYDYPQKCTKYNLLLLLLLQSVCERYEPDTSKPKEWHVVNDPSFIGGLLQREANKTAPASTAMDHAPTTLLFFFVACYCSSSEYFVAGGVASGSAQPLENQMSTMVNFSNSASLSSVQPRIVTDIHSGGHRLAEVSEDKNTNEVVSCNLLGEQTLIKLVLAVIPAAQVTNVSTEEMNQLVNTCMNIQQMTSGSSILDTLGDTLHSLVIFPGNSPSCK